MESIKRLDKHGNIEYRKENGLYHREDGPAYERPDGYRVWYINGMYHREDGPAIEFYDGDFRYYLNHTRYSKEEYEKEILKIKLERLKEL